MVQRWFICLMVLGVAACGSSSSPTAPSIPSHNLVVSGPVSWDTFGGFSTYIRNMGRGCASGTTVSVTFAGDFIGDGVYPGPYRLMAYGGLKDLIIRPSERVEVWTFGSIEDRIRYADGFKYTLDIKANSVICP